MVIRHAVSHAAAGLVALTLGVAAGSSSAYAQATVLKECGSRYQAAKSANELNGKTWQDYLKECRESLKAAEGGAAPAAAPAEAAKPAEAEKPAEAAKPAEEAAPAAAPNPLKPPTTTAAPEPAAEPAKPVAKMTTKERQKKCGEEWKAQKAELKKTDPKITWPKFWSACNKRLKEGE